MKATTTASILTACLCCLQSLSQDNLGIAGSNYSPVNTVLVNPSSIVDSKAFIDINFAGLGLYVHNDFVYLPKEDFSFFSLIKDPATVPMPAFNSSRRRYYSFADVTIHGPSATFAVGNNSFGVYTGARSVTDVRGVSSTLTEMGLNGIYHQQFDGVEQSVKNLRINSLAWAEFGLSAGRIISKEGRDMWTAGITLKRLIAGGGASIHMDEWNFTMVDSSLVTHSIRGNYGFNNPGWNTGRGWATDLGVTFKRALNDVSSYTPHSKSSGCETCDYQFKWSIALLDIGRIKFDPEFYVNQFDETEESDWDELSDFGASDAAGLDQNINEGLGFPTDAGETHFRMWLPGALSTQFDYNFGHHIYVNSSLIMGIPWRNASGPQRGSQIAITPRYELKRLEFALPFVLHEYKYPSIGAMLRLNSIIIGTDNLGTYLFNQDVYGADIYVNVKYTIFKSWKCRTASTKVAKPQKKRRGYVPCPAW